MKELPELFQEDGHVLHTKGKQFFVKCPFHEEKTPSCHLSPGTKGWFYHCFGCGASGDDIEYLYAYRGIPKRESLKAKSNNTEYSGSSAYTAQRKETGRRSQNERQVINTPPKNYVERYKYYNADKRLAFIIQRYEIDGEKVFGQYTPQVNGTWVKGLTVANNRPLYRLLDVLESDKRKQVMVVEGEKCANLVKEKFKSTIVCTWACGTGSTHLTDFSPLHGRSVLLVADSNAQGYLCMAEIARRLAPHSTVTLVLPTLTWNPDDEYDIGDLIEKEPKAVSEFIKSNNHPWNEDSDNRMRKLDAEFTRRKEKSKKQLTAIKTLKNNDHFNVSVKDDLVVLESAPVGEIQTDFHSITSRHALMSLCSDRQFWNDTLGDKVSAEKITKAIVKAAKV